MIRFVEKYFGGLSGETVPFGRHCPEIYIPQQKEVVKGTFQNYCILGNIAYDYREEKRLLLSVLVDILGGSGMNSRLNLNLREKHGLVYNIEASYTPYSDTGIFTVYFGCDAADLEKCLKLCRREMEMLYSEPLGLVQLRKAKTQAIGQLTLSAENYENTMLSIGKSFLVYDKVESIECLCKKIEEIDAGSLQQVAAEILDTGRQSVLVYK